MHKESEEAIRTLRAKVAEEREVLEKLRADFNQPSMKKWVDSVRSDLDDVENVFLSTLDNGLRTAAEEAAVIRNAAIPLQMAIPKRMELEKALADYGVDAVLIPSN